MISIEDLLKSDRKVAQVEIEGGVVYVRSLTAGEMISVRAAIRKTDSQDEGVQIRAALAEKLAAYLCDESGQVICTREQADQLMDARSQDLILSLIKAGDKLNLMDEEAEEDARKN